jgi:VWFA-related protein
MFAFTCSAFVFGQRGSDPAAGSVPSPVPNINIYGGTLDSQFGRLDFAQKMLEQQSKKPNAKEIARRKELVDSGVVSALDLFAPSKAVNEFNEGTALAHGRQSQEAIRHLEKAVKIYPSFVSAHDYLGMVYIDADQPAKAKLEFETAVKLDDKFSSSWLNLGRLALSQSDPAAAQSYIEKAATLRPSDPAVLTTLAYAQLNNYEYADAILTVTKVHALSHPQAGNAHYISALAAVSLNQTPIAKSEFAQFLVEDPNNPLADNARYNIDVLTKNERAVAAAKQQQASLPGENPANSERLHAQLAAADADPGEITCPECNARVTVASASPAALSIPSTEPSVDADAQWRIRKVVDEVAVFFGITGGGRTINGLDLSEITVLDDNKPPQRVLQFTPQATLPLRIGLLIDTSGSVESRFTFEKRAAAKFLEQILSNSSDLGFVAGFADTVKVTQDFTDSYEDLSAGINALSNSGGTALFDAVSRACMKLASYPEHERVATVLVVLSDGEENASHNTLRQTIRDLEATGVTVYTISTKQAGTDKTEADKVLQMLAERSGGESFFPGDIQTLARSFDKLRDEIRSRYLIAYKPSDFEPNGKYRTIAITAEKDGKRLQVHARKGYHARAEAPAQ